MLVTFLLLLHIPFCICIDTITANQSITDNNVLLSKKGLFALGFFSPGNSRNTYLGIWYHKLPGKTLVWVANREEPINGSSGGVLSMNPDGNLALYNDHGGRSFPLWLTNVSLDANGSYEAQLLDSGNLVLIQVESKRVVWQSFDHPTDTLLPGMKLGLDRKTGLVFCITSWRSEEDPGAGDFTFKLNPSGSPQLILYKGSSKYWRSAPWPWNIIVRATIPENVYRLNFTFNRDEVYYRYFVNDESIFTRSVLSSSGLLQRLTWDNSSCQWKRVWSAPQYVYGYCGPNSINNGNNVEFECTCLPGYEPKSLKNWQLRDGSDGCVKKRQTISMCRNGEAFLKISQLRLPDTSVAALLSKTMPGKECKQLCLSNCSCLAFAGLDIDGKGIGCLTWYGDLLDTVQLLEGNDMYVRVDAIELAESEGKRRSFLRKKGVLAIMVVSAAPTMFLFIMIAYLWLRKKREKTVQRKRTKRIFQTLVKHETAENRQPPALPLFDLDTISAATDKFSPANKLGQGGFGSVYKGQLPDGQEIAVKRLSQSSRQGIEELKNEVMSIARLQHRNLVKLLGCCIQREERMLVYEYLPNKSLDFFIFDQRRRSLLDWGKRFDIIVGIARGVLYLHHDSRLRIIHRDLKASNVLLDAEMNPKISDFGMARVVQGDQVQDKTNRVVGTYGYMSPEYALYGKFSTKSDVFSFGVILLEIISGKKSNSSHQDNPSWNLIAHVWDLWREERAMDIVDSSLIDSCSVPPTEVCRCIQIGLLCVQEEAADRPTMATVLVMLNGETSLPCPKQPAFIFRKCCMDSKTPPVKGGADNVSVNGLTITMAEAR